ncbi:MAG: GIY-YIG nuclease family protein [Gemmataceae bacterium]
MSESAGTKIGYVYIFVSPAIPALVKIGRTSGQPEFRAREVSRGTGVPAEYQVAWACPVSDCFLVERLIHDHLSEDRYRSNREFFELPVAEAIERCSRIAEGYRQDPEAECSSSGLGLHLQSAMIPSTQKAERKSRTELVPLNSADRSKLMVRAGYTIRPWVEDYLAAVEDVCPDILVRVRGDGKAIFVPPNLAHRGTMKNLTTINPGRTVFWLRIVDDVEKLTGVEGEQYQPNLLDSYKVRLRKLFNRL